MTKFKCGIRDEITRISGNVSSTSGAQFACCHPVKVRDLRMGTVFTLREAWVARVPNNTGIEFNREPNFRHPAEERYL